MYHSPDNETIIISCVAGEDLRAGQLVYRSRTGYVYACQKGVFSNDQRQDFLIRCWHFIRRRPNNPNPIGVVLIDAEPGSSVDVMIKGTFTISNNVSFDEFRLEEQWKQKRN